jgi:hypothetical protein
MTSSVCKDKDQLLSIIADYLNDFEYATVVDIIKFGGTWQLLEVFLLDRFSGDFLIRNEKGVVTMIIENQFIRWHLDAIAKGMLQGKSELGTCYGPKYASHFTIEPGNILERSQEKLTFSLLYFCLLSSQKGYNTIYEGGGGLGTGGVNHTVVCNILNDLQKPMVMELIDPGHCSMEDTKIGKSTIRHVNGFVSAESKFDNPIYCDVYDNSNYMDIQRDLEAPLKMMKSFSGNVANMVLQPHHYETRVVKNKQFPYIIAAIGVDVPEFDNCRDCLLWKALCLEYGISSDVILRHLMTLGFFPCKRLMGAGTQVALTRGDTEKMFKVSQNYDQSNVNYVDYPGLNDISVRNTKEIAVRGPTEWETLMISFVRDKSHHVFEVLDSKKYPMSKLFPNDFRSDGVAFIRDNVLPPGIKQCYFEYTEKTESDVHNRLASYGLDIVDITMLQGKSLLFAQQSGVVIMSCPMIIEVHHDWKITGTQRLECVKHGNSCCGLWCDKRVYEAWKKNGRIMFVKFVDAPKFSFEYLVKNFSNFSIPMVADDTIARMLREYFYLDIQYKLVLQGMRINDLQQTMLRALVGIGVKDFSEDGLLQGFSVIVSNALSSRIRLTCDEIEVCVASMQDCNTTKILYDGGIKTQSVHALDNYLQEVYKGLRVMRSPNLSTSTLSKRIGRRKLTVTTAAAIDYKSKLKTCD